MKYYKTYNFAAGFLLIAFSIFAGVLFFWSEPRPADAVQMPQQAVAKQTLNNDSGSSGKNLAKIEDVPDGISTNNSDNESLFTQNPLGEISPIEIRSSDSGNLPDLTSEMGLDTESGTRTIQSGSAGTVASAVAADVSGTASTAPAAEGSAGSSGTSGSGSGTGSADSSGASGSGSSGGGGGGGGTSDTLPAELFKPKGIAAIFLHPDEIRKNNRLLSLATVMDNLLKYDAFWYAQGIANEHPEAWKTLRNQYPNRLAMHYITPFSIGLSVESYLDYNYVNQNHPEWFLLKNEKNASARDYRNPDKRMRWNPDDSTDVYYNRFFLDVGNEEFQRWAVDEFIKKLDPVTGVNARIRYSGIVADNVLLTAWYTVKTKLYPHWKYAADASSWNQAYFSYLKRLHDALKKEGYILIVNHTTDYSSNRDGKEWQDLMAVVDGMANEEVLGAPSAVWGGEMWDWSLKHHEETLQKGLYDWWIFIPDMSDSKKANEQFLYVYCSFLLVKNEGLSLFGTIELVNGVGLNSWHEEYTLPLGDPVGLRYQQQGCWLRDYQHAKIVVNPGSNRCTIPLESEVYTLDWQTKKTVTRVTLEPRTATILLPTGYSVK